MCLYLLLNFNWSSFRPPFGVSRRRWSFRLIPSFSTVPDSPPLTLMAEPEVQLSMEEIERKKKKEEKAKMKEMKKQKAAQKAEAAKSQVQSSNTSKKSERKNLKRDVEEENPEHYADPETSAGQKKLLSRIMAKQFNPSAVEKSWYPWWEKSGFFVADSQSSKKPYVIVLPPPNVTGALHIGHALTSAIEDMVIRWRRMSGDNTLWVPGMDHAGIATQVVVEKKIMRERNLTRHDLGRENFVSEVWSWKNEYGGTILGQLRRLGASLDWSREVDYIEIKEKTLLKIPGYKNAVEFGVLTSFAYPLEDNPNEKVVVATTRVETMLGDTAIAIHPDDTRYKHLHGKFAIHPFNQRRIPIVTDAILVDPKFGTGCVKITPAHDPNDFDVGKRHKLEYINIFTDDGRINSNGGSLFEGMPRFQAREAVTEALKEKGLYVGAQNNEMRLGVCSRSNDVVEPLIKPQWYVNCNSMAKEALDAVMDGNKKRIEIIPKQYTAEWKRWLENIRDWCISRQLWWGHRVPAWYVSLDDDKLKELGAYRDHWVVARDELEAQAEAGRLFPGKRFQITQDPDVLDTWFSAGLFPLSVLGWPDETADLRTFYPTSTLETGHDILFFWVARMVMLCTKLGGDVPFRKVYLHPMIRDAHGRKMSKSLGNVIDPLEVINGVSLEGLHKRLEEGNLDRNELAIAKEGQKKDFPNGIAECGADALRFALVSYTAQSDKINLDIQRVVGYRQWCNKLWNATRFAMSKLGDGYTPPVVLKEIPQEMPFSCKWILSVLNKAINKTVASLENSEFSDAANAVYSWWQYQLCDVFIEVIKPYFSSNDQSYSSERKFAQDVLWICLDTGLRLLHPFMPFITEELWQRLPQSKDCTRKESIMISEYPSRIESWENGNAETKMNIIESTVRSLRSLKSTMPPNEQRERRPAYALCRSDEIVDIISSHELEILTLASVATIKVIGESRDAGPGCAVDIVNEHLSVYLKVRGAISAEAEREKMRKKTHDINEQLKRLQDKMSASGYREKVPAHIHKENEEKILSLKMELLSVEEASQHLEQDIAAENQA
ncbi:hypothetical protein V2J09_012177 [Rumex salicifolius]